MPRGTARPCHPGFLLMTPSCGRVTVFVRVRHAAIPRGEDEESLEPIRMALHLGQVGHCCITQGFLSTPGSVGRSSAVGKAFKTAGNSNESILGPGGVAGCNLNEGNFLKGT